LKNGGASYVTSQTLDLDDLLVVLYAAAELLMRSKQADAQMKLSMAEARFNYLRAAYPTRRRSVVLGGAAHPPRKRLVSIKLVGV